MDDETIEDLPDGNRNIVFTNFAGEAILNVFVMMQGRQETTKRWCNYYRYDDAGRLIMEALPSAVAGYDESDPRLVSLKANSGLIRLHQFYASSADGGASGRPRVELVQKGSAGTPIKLKEWKYAAHTVGADTVYRTSEETVFQSDSAGGSDPATTAYTYTWQHFQVRERTTIWPLVPVEQNGSGLPESRVEAYDSYGLLTHTKDARGYINASSYDSATDARLRKVEDVAGGAPWPVLPGLHLNLVTDYTVDDEGRSIQELGPDHEIDLDGTATRIRRARWTVYLDDVYQQYEGAGYQTVSDGSQTLINPVRISVFDETMRLRDELQAIRSNTSGPLRPTDSFPQSSWVRWTRNLYDGWANIATRRVYYAVPAGGEGERDLNYNQTEYGYDINQRRVRERSPGGTITRHVYYPRGWVLERWIGTDDTGADDTHPAGAGAPANDMALVERYAYDSGKAGADGNLTRYTRQVNDAQQRVTSYRYDWRDRGTSAEGEIDFWEGYTFDNLDQITRIDQRNTAASGTLVRRSESRYDRRQRTYRQLNYGVDPATGAVSAPLMENSWFDAAGNLIKRQAFGSRAFTKTVYDGVNRAVKTYLACDPDETAYADAGSVLDDLVAEQTETTYDEASNRILEVQRARFHDATGTGELTDPNGAQPKARVSYTANWPDALARIKNQANYGTHGGTTPSRPAVAPARSDTVLISTTDHNHRGEAWQTADPAGRLSQTQFDAGGRKTREIENVVPGGTAADQNKEMLFAYTADGTLHTLTARNSATGDQVTRWEYGTAREDSGVASTLLLRAKLYPDSQIDRVEFRYNRLGEMTEIKDQRGTVHAYDFDLLGRLLHDRVTALGAGTDTAVRRLSYGYDTRGLIVSVASADDPSSDTGSILNEVRAEYDAYRQTALERQSHQGAVTLGTPAVAYTYADGSQNTVRLEQLTYPNGRVLARTYGAGGSLDDLLDREEALADGTGGQPPRLVEYEYVGSGAVAVARYPQPDLELTYVKLGHEPVGDGGDPYTGWDRFGRIVDQRWLKETTGADVERLQYGYDRDGNRLHRRNVVAGSGWDELYHYDGLNQLDRLQRGTLNAQRTALTGTPAWEEDFTFDPVGNWANYLTTVNGAPTLDQTRAHNPVNEITAIGGGSFDPVAYDAAGNMTAMPKAGDWATGQTLTWDAWNRLVTVAEGSSKVATYRYDGFDRRISKELGAASTPETRHFYYSVEWQVIEERVDAGTTPDRQFVWGRRYPDDLVLRDREPATANERLYATHNQWHVASVAESRRHDSGTLRLLRVRRNNRAHPSLQPSRRLALRLGNNLRRVPVRCGNEPVPGPTPLLAFGARTLVVPRSRRI